MRVQRTVVQLQTSQVSGIASDAASVVKDEDNDLTTVVDDNYCDETTGSEIHSELISLKVGNAADITIHTLEEASKLLEVIAKSPSVSPSSLSVGLADDAPGLVYDTGTSIEEPDPVIDKQRRVMTESYMTVIMNVTLE